MPAASAVAAVPADPDGDAAPAEHGAGTGAQAPGTKSPGFADRLQQEVLASNQGSAVSNFTVVVADRMSKMENIQGQLQP